jgi:hypothetical protein
MVNRRLKSAAEAVDKDDCRSLATDKPAVRAHFRHDGCVNPILTIGLRCPEVVLAQAILGLLLVSTAYLPWELRNKADPDGVSCGSIGSIG